MDSAPISELNANDDHAAEQLDAQLERSHKAALDDPEVPLSLRLDRLKRLSKLVDENFVQLSAAIHDDFGQRSRQESEAIEFSPLQMALRRTIRHLPHWIAPQRRAALWFTLPADAYVDPRPLGVIGILSPWNYPVILTLGPTIDALAAGNRVLIKPSELVPKTSEALAELVPKYFQAEEISVHCGGAKLAAHFSKLPFDHLVFTGSTEVGKKVAAAAAQNLVPVTLELGGRSPTWIDPALPLSLALPALMRGKLLNAGQTCVAPNHLYISREQLPAFEREAPLVAQKLYPQGLMAPDYTSLISPRHYQRMQQMVEQALSLGARRVPLFQESASKAHERCFPPCLLFEVNADMQIMQEEIFGPVLPVVAMDQASEEHPLPEEFLRSLRTPPHPLALIAFSERSSVLQTLRKHTRSGMLVANAPLVHVAQDGLPFGGLGDSGIGHYHGHDGFLRFSHPRSYYRQRRPNGLSLGLPPFGDEMKGKIRSFLRKWA